jgi:alpha-tubulin suppressor-like RCC1 family protein
LIDPRVKKELLPKSVDALRGVRVGSIASCGPCSYSVTDLGEVWAWERDNDGVFTPLGGCVYRECPPPTPLPSLRGIKVDAMVVSSNHTLAVADDGGMYAWGSEDAAELGALGLDPSMNGVPQNLRTPRRIPALRAACAI